MKPEQLVEEHKEELALFGARVLLSFVFRGQIDNEHLLERLSMSLADLSFVKLDNDTGYVAL